MNTYTTNYRENKAKTFEKHTAVRCHQCIACVYLFLFARKRIGRRRRSCYSGQSTTIPADGSKNIDPMR